MRPGPRGGCGAWYPWCMARYHTKTFYEAPEGKPRCGAVTRTPNEDGTRRYCQLAAGYGTDHLGYGTCSKHGGLLPNNRKGAAREAGRQFIMARHFGGDIDKVADLSAEQALVEEVRRSAAMVRFLQDHIAQWAIPDPEDRPADLGGLPDLLSETSKGFTSFTNEREWLTMYREERAHLAKVSKMCIDAGLAERMVRLAEDQGRIIVAVIRQVLDALGLTPDQHALIPQVVPPILSSFAQQVALPAEILVAGSSSE